MKYELRSIPVWPFVRISFFVNLVVGFLIGLLYAMFFGMIMSIMQSFPGGQDMAMQEIPVGMLVIIMPIGFAVFGAVFNTFLGVIVLFCYNSAARLVGGLELELRNVPAPGLPQQPTVQSPIYANTAMSTWQAQPTITPPVQPGPRPEPPQNPPSGPPLDYNL